MTDQPMPAARLAEIEGRATDPCVSAYRTYKIMREQDIPALVAEVRRLREELRRIARTAEMSAEIMRDPRRTGGWDGAERVANSYGRMAIKARAALGETSNTTAGE